MATQEMEIIVTAKVEKASKEFQKLVPTIKQITNQIQQAFSKIDTKSMQNNVQQSINFLKNKMQEFKVTTMGNMVETFQNAWNYNGNGDVIVQNLADAFNNLLTTINNIVHSDGFQNFLNFCSEKFREMSEKLASINWQPFIEVLANIGETIGIVALNILNGIIDIFKWLVENPIVVEILLSIATAIGIVSTALSIWSTVQGILNAVLTASPITWIILGITALIAAIILIVAHWEKVSSVLSVAWDWIKQKAIDIWNGIAEFFKNIWQGICNIATNIWNAITTAISNVINGIKTVITNVLNAISTIWNNIWTGISNVVKNVWNGIWGCIRGVINLILGGIEGFVNGVIRGVNILLSGISKVANAVGNLIGLPSINLQLSTISLPRLAKGGVLTKATAIIAGEYSGASSNPEIVTPQNIMEETFGRVMSKYNNNNNQQHLSIHYMGKEIFNDTIDYINEKTRRTGKCVIKVGG